MVVNSAITFLTEPPDIFWMAQLPSLSSGSPLPQFNIVNQLPFPGGYPTIDVMFDCPNIGSVAISPPSVSVSAGESLPLLAGTYGPDKLLLESSSITFGWESQDTAVATVPSSGQQVPAGTWNEVTGQTSGVGQTTKVSATEQRTGNQGESTITVSECAPGSPLTSKVTPSSQSATATCVAQTGGDNCQTAWTYFTYTNTSVSCPTTLPANIPDGINVTSFTCPISACGYNFGSGNSANACTNYVSGSQISVPAGQSCQLGFQGGGATTPTSSPVTGFIPRPGQQPAGDLR